jgi:hypothetical protein
VFFFFFFFQCSDGSLTRCLFPKRCQQRCTPSAYRTVASRSERQSCFSLSFFVLAEYQAQPYCLAPFNSVHLRAVSCPRASAAAPRTFVNPDRGKIDRHPQLASCGHVPGVVYPQHPNALLLLWRQTFAAVAISALSQHVCDARGVQPRTYPAQQGYWCNSWTCLGGAWVCKDHAHAHDIRCLPTALWRRGLLALILHAYAIVDWIGPTL